MDLCSWMESPLTKLFIFIGSVLELLSKTGKYKFTYKNLVIGQYIIPRPAENCYICHNSSYSIIFCMVIQWNTKNCQKNQFTMPIGKNYWKYLYNPMWIYNNICQWTVLKILWWLLNVCRPYRSDKEICGVKRLCNTWEIKIRVWIHILYKCFHNISHYWIRK